MHGHNWTIVVEIEGSVLNDNGMVVDFTDIKTMVYKYDHGHLNDLMKNNPTAENLAFQLSGELQYFLEGKYPKTPPEVVGVMVEGTKGNQVWWTR